jgi:hypothetical protein
MPPTVRDASLVTQRKRNMALNSYYETWKAATVNSSSPVSGLKAPAATGAEVVKQISAGCRACYILDNEALKEQGLGDPNLSRYPANPSAGGASGLTGQS